VPKTKARIAPYVKKQTAATVEKVQKFTTNVQKYSKSVKSGEVVASGSGVLTAGDFQFWSIETGAQKAVALLDKAQSGQDNAMEEVKKMQYSADMFDCGGEMQEAQKAITAVQAMLTNARKMWTVLTSTDEYIEKSKMQLWSDVSPEQLEEDAKDMMKKIKGLHKDVRQSTVYKDVEKKGKDFLNTCPLILALRHPSMRERHWKQLMEATGKTFTPPMDDPTLKLQGLLDLNLHEYTNDVEEITDKAQKELKMEQGLKVENDVCCCRIRHDTLQIHRRASSAHWRRRFRNSGSRPAHSARNDGLALRRPI
jgi:dynein heavy chain